VNTKNLPLKEQSIAEIYNGEKATYEVPIYQRNFSWGKDEISALVQDVYDACNSDNTQTYFIGTLVSFHKGDQIYEVIDGQQRLTTIYFVLSALGIHFRNELTYRARKKSNDTIQSIPEIDIDDKDSGIERGFQNAINAINDIVPGSCKEKFKSYFQEKVHIIHYQVPKDIDLNHYFEIMNSRGEQLEKHEIIKARLIEKLGDADKAKFNCLWEFVSEMNVHVQQKYRNTDIFGTNHCEFKISSFDELPAIGIKFGTRKISEFIDEVGEQKEKAKPDVLDRFQPIMDFSNFLLIVLKLTQIEEIGSELASIILDDKELIKAFSSVEVDEEFVKGFAFNLLKAKYLLDNYLVHHSNDDEKLGDNTWKLQYWYKDGKNEYLKNLGGESGNDQHYKLVQLLSMFEVSFTPRQRKNYLFYCLVYLFRSPDLNIRGYLDFVVGMAEKYFIDVYLAKDKLSENNTPKPGSFDNSMFYNNKLDISLRNSKRDFTSIYGDGASISRGIPLFIFNYLDYKLWEKYAETLRGKSTTERDQTRKEFFDSLGCSDFGLKIFEQFCFSRTRRSLEHYYPTALAKGENGTPNSLQINCLGNFAMIGSEANSSGSNWTPKTKLDHYLDASGKIKQVSVASIKLMSMMQKCKDNQVNRKPGQEWVFEDIKAHQDKMLNLLIVKENEMSV